MHLHKRWAAGVRVFGARRTLLTAWVLGVASISMYLRHRVPLLVYGDATHDDHLFAFQSDQLFRGHWLGEFDTTLTLAKGPGFAAFLTLCRLLGVPLLLAEHTLHLLAAAIFALAARRLSRSSALGTAAFTALALDPSYLGGDASRVIRDNWYGSICLFLFGWICLALADLARRRTAPTALTWIRAFAHGTAIGLLAATYYLGREDRPWLVPAVATMSIAAVLVCRHRGWARIAELVLVVITSSLVAGLAVDAVAERNHDEYGVSLTNDLIEGAFPDAFATWQSVDAGPARRYVPISRAQRVAAYEVSPAAAELAYYLEGPAGAGWIAHGCESASVCDDLAGGWIPWAMRQAARETGRYNDGRSAQQFYSRIAEEIQAACDNGRLRCHAQSPALLPDPDLLSPRALADSFRSAAWALGTFRAARHRADEGPASASSEPSWLLFRSAVPGTPSTIGEQRERERHYADGARTLLVWKSIWAWVMPGWFLLSLVGVAAGPIKRPGRWKASFALAVACYVAVGGRLAVLALVDSTSFPAAESGYLLLPASGFLIAGAVIGTHLLWTCNRGPMAITRDK